METLEQAFKKYNSPAKISAFDEVREHAFIAGANWQKEQDADLVEALKECKMAFESLVRNDIISSTHHPECEKYIQICKAALNKAVKGE